MVAAATQNLCEAANAMVQGHGTEEKLVSAARQVASSTAQLLVACKVKADADSVAMRRLQVSSIEGRLSSEHFLMCTSLIDPQLSKSRHSIILLFFVQAAGNAVKRATEALVRAAKRAKEGGWDDDEDVSINQRMVGGIAQVPSYLPYKRGLNFEIRYF